MGPAVAAGARVVLACMFLWSAFAKVRARRALPALLTDFGLPRGVVRAMTFGLPACEAAIAVALLVFWESSIPAWTAVALLALFTVQLVRAIPRHVPCPCFGTAAAAPASAASVVRNAVLLALAVLATGSPSGASA